MTIDLSSYLVLKSYSHMTTPELERLRDLCAKLASSASGPEFDQASRDLLAAIENHTRVAMTDVVLQIQNEEDPEKKLALIENLKGLLDDEEQRSGPAKAS